MDVSTAELTGEWEVEILQAQQRITLQAGDGELSPECNSWCSKETVSRDGRTGDKAATVSVEIVHLAAKNEFGVFTISMLDEALFGGVRLGDEGRPLLTADESPNFWLEGLMTIKLRLTGSKEVISLVSKQPVLQVGRATSWPPYNTTMRDVSGPNEYYRADDPDKRPFLVLWGGSITIGDKPSAFLAANITIDSFEYLGEATAPHGVKLSWVDQRPEVPLIDHYHVLRRLHDLHGAGSWKQIGGCIDGDALVDPDFDGRDAVTYKVRQVFVDVLGDEVRGCGIETDFTVPALPTNREQLAASGFWSGWR